MPKSYENTVNITIGVALSAALGYCIFRCYKCYASLQSKIASLELEVKQQRQQQEEINKYFAQLHLLNGLRIDEVTVQVYEDEDGNPSLPYEKQANLELLAQARLTQATLLATEIHSPQLKSDLESITHNFIEQHRITLMGATLYDESPVSPDCEIQP